MTKDNRGFFYLGNAGKIYESDKNIKASIVKVNSDFEIVNEIFLYDRFPDMKTCQGLTVDSSNSTLWFCSFGENKIRNIRVDGIAISFFDIKKPTGIAYDDRSDSLWVLTYTKLLNINKSGEVLRSFKVKLEGQDQIFLNKENNDIYITAGLDYQGASYVYKINLDSGKLNLEYILKESHAIEGIYIEDHQMYILNDGLFHNATIKRNIINIYDIFPSIEINIKNK